MARRRLIVTALRGSGGSYTHLASVLPRIREDHPEWDVELFTTAEVVQRSFGGTPQGWVHVLPDSGYGARLRWEFRDLPAILKRDRGALVYSPLNLAIANRVVWMSRNIIPLLPLTEWEVEAADRVRLLGMRLLVHAFARRARKSICVSEHARDLLVALTGVPRDRVAVIPHGIDPPLGELTCRVAALEDLRRSRYILHVGQPIRYRRTRELIIGYAKLANARQDLPPLVLIGKARSADLEYEQECAALLGPLLREGRAFAVGEARHAEARALMASAHAFVYPSVHENCPNVVLEALQAQRPSVFADIPPVRELAADAALYAANPGPSDLADAIERVVFDDRLRGQLSVAARLRASMFTWSRTITETNRVLEEAFEAD